MFNLRNTGKHYAKETVKNNHPRPVSSLKESDFTVDILMFILHLFYSAQFFIHERILHIYFRHLF